MVRPRECILAAPTRGGGHVERADRRAFRPHLFKEVFASVVGGAETSSGYSLPGEGSAQSECCGYIPRSL